MTSNGKPHFSTNIFQNQPNGEVSEAVNAAVGQDKVRATRVRIGTNQPVILKTTARTRQRDTENTRSPTHSTKCQTVQVAAWVKHPIRAELQRIAKQEGLSMSATIAALLEAAIRHKLHIQQGVLLEPIIKQAIRKEIHAYSSRIAMLLVRNIFDAGQTKAIVNNLLSRQPGVNDAVLKTILARAQQLAKGNITRKTPQLTELIEAVEKWLREDAEGTHGSRENHQVHENARQR
jgi:hypothetical protein